MLGQDSAVVVEEVTTTCGATLAVATLNAERTLNSLSRAMIDILTPALARWAADPEIVAVVLKGAGDRAFCAGGDVRALHDSIKRNLAAGRLVDDFAESFFAAEYRLDYGLHTFTKPLLCYGDGIVMGGGLGLFSASRFRLATDRSRVAMPEVTIGLFPDAGGTWVLKSLPRHVALFFGATGSELNAADAFRVGLATHVIERDWGALIDVLRGIEWAADPSDVPRIEAALAMRAANPPASRLARFEERIASVLDPLPESTAALGEAVRSLAGEDPFLDAAVETMRRGCPTTVGIVLEQVRRLPHLTLADSFRLELTVATHCARNPEFAEGVRALLVDKDKSPRWLFDDLDALPETYVASHFVEPWPTHPLADLGR